MPPFSLLHIVETPTKRRRNSGGFHKSHSPNPCYFCDFYKKGRRNFFAWRSHNEVQTSQANLVGRGGTKKRVGNLEGAAVQSEMFKPDGPPTIAPSLILYDPEKDVLGSGSFGTVYRGRIQGTRVAVKVPNKQYLLPAEKQEFLHEIGVMKKVFHPNIVLFLGACVEKKIMIVTELMSCSLEDFLYQPDRVPEPLRVPCTPALKLRLCTDMCLAVNWLHSVVGLVHRDLKPENFMLDENGRVKVTDFGFTVFPKEIDRNDKEWKGTPLYLSSEVLNDNLVTPACDVYALGYILWQTFTLLPLFLEYEDFDAFIADVIDGPVRPEITPDVPPLFVPTLRRMWDRNPTLRPTANDVLEMLHQVNLKSCLTDPDGLAFWLKHFYNGKTGDLKLEVTKDELLGAVAHSVHASAQAYAEVAHLIPEPLVTPAVFQSLINYYGAFFAEKAVLDEMLDIASAAWFAGPIPRETAKAWLAGRVEGTFLVRASTNTPEFPFCVSFMHLGKDHHYRVSRVTTKNAAVRLRVKNLENKEVEAKTLPELLSKCVACRMVSSVCPHSVENTGYN